MSINPFSPLSIELRPEGLHSVRHILMEKFVGFTDQRLSQLKTQNRRVKPVEISSPIAGVINYRIKKLTFTAVFVSKDILF